VRALPGTDAATVAEVPYLSNNEEIADFLHEGQAQDQNKEQSAHNNVVGQNFFQTLGIPILAGRGFNGRDMRSSIKVAVITQKLAARAFPGLNQIGRNFRTHMLPVAGKTGEGDLVEIVGVCADTHYSSLREDPPGIFYLPYMQAENLSRG
jgi:hypothetical protein